MYLFCPLIYHNKDYLKNIILTNLMLDGSCINVYSGYNTRYTFCYR